MEEHDLLDRLGLLIKEVKNIQPSVKEFTFFDIGGKGHRERPLAEALAFFVNPHGEHGMGHAVLDALLSLLDVQRDDGTPVAAGLRSWPLAGQVVLRQVLTEATEEERAPAALELDWACLDPVLAQQLWRQWGGSSPAPVATTIAALQAAWMGMA